MPIFNFLLSAFIEFGPALAFLKTALFFDFFTGVKVLIFSTILALLLSIWRDRRIPVFMGLNSLFVFIFSTSSLYFHNEYLVVLEFTIYNSLFGLGVIWGYIMDKPIMKIMFGTMFSITDKGWHRLSIRWGIMFFITAIGNELIWRFYNPHVWIYYRFLSVLVLTIFGLSQFFLSKKERLPGSSPWGLKIFT